MKSKGPENHAVNFSVVNAMITNAASHFSEIRRIRSLFWDYQDRLAHLDSMISTQKRDGRRLE